MPDRDLDADIVFHEFVRRRTNAHEHPAQQEATGHQRPDAVDEADLTAGFASLPEVDDEVIVAQWEHASPHYEAVVPDGADDDAPLGSVGLEIDELDDLNL